MDLDCPEILYKYTSTSTTKIILESGRVRWSSPSQFNDLKEFQRMPIFSPSLEEVWEIYIKKLVDITYGKVDGIENRLSSGTNLLLTLMGSLKVAVDSKEKMFKLVNMACPSQQSKMSDLFREHTESLNNDYARVFCLTTEYNNDVMWAHYAENHGGCVLGFKHIPELDTPFIAAKPVKYTDGSPIVGSGLDFLLYGDTPELRAKTVEAIFYSKEVRWSYENEWRVITWRYNETGKKFADYKFYKTELDSVTFGPRIEKNKYSEIRQIIHDNYPDCKTFEMFNVNLSAD